MNKCLINEFQQLGLDEKSAVLALQVYLELCEVKRYWNPEYEYNASLKKLIIKAQKKRTAPCSFFIPISSYENLSFLKLQQFLDNVKENNLFLAIVHPDSTCVYYQISKGLVEPTETTAKHLRINRQERLDADLRNHRKTIEQAALLGIPITIPKEKAKETESFEESMQVEK